MARDELTCAVCGRAFAAGAPACPNCHTPVTPAAPSSDTSVDPAFKLGQNISCGSCEQSYNSTLPNCPNCGAATPGHFKPPEGTPALGQAPANLACSRCRTIYPSAVTHCPNCGHPNPLPGQVLDLLAGSEEFLPGLTMSSAGFVGCPNCSTLFDAGNAACPNCRAPNLSRRIQHGWLGDRGSGFGIFGGQPTVKVKIALWAVVAVGVLVMLAIAFRN